MAVTITWTQCYPLRPSAAPSADNSQHKDSSRSILQYVLAYDRSSLGDRYESKRYRFSSGESDDVPPCAESPLLTWQPRAAHTVRFCPRKFENLFGDHLQSEQNRTKSSKRKQCILDCASWRKTSRIRQTEAKVTFSISRDGQSIAIAKNICATGFFVHENWKTTSRCFDSTCATNPK